MERVFVIGKEMSLVTQVARTLVDVGNTKPPTPGTTTFVVKPSSKICGEIEQTRGIRGVIVVVSLERHCVSVVTNYYSEIRATTCASKLVILPMKTSNEGQVTIDELNQNLETAKHNWELQIKEEINRIRAQKICLAAQERLNLLESWLNSELAVHVSAPVSPDIIQNNSEIWSTELYHLMCNIEPDSQTRLEIEEDNPNVLVQIDKQERLKLPDKPPVIHWTPIPRAEELQMSLRVHLLSWLANDQWVENLANEMCLTNTFAHAEYSYRWTNGLLARYDLYVKVCLNWEEPCTISLSCRVDVDEIGDAKRSANEILWKHLAPYANTLIQYLESSPRLPYKVSVIPIGAIYFETPCTNECSFDLTTLLTEKEKSSRYAFKPDPLKNPKARNTFFINRCFPGLRKSSLQDLRVWLTQMENNHIISAPSPADDTTSPQSDQPPQSKVSFAGMMDSNMDPDLLLPEEPRTGRRKSIEGRRVSFGHVLVGGTVVGDANTETDASLVAHLEQFMQNANIQQSSSS